VRHRGATAAAALGGDGENGRWADWVGRKLGLVGCTGENGEGKRWAEMWAGASKLCCKGGLRGGGRKRKKREGNSAGRRELAQQGWNSLFSVSNSFVIPRFESNVNRIQNRTKFYLNLKLKHSFKSKQNASSMKCNKQIFIKPKLI
jgi:hypothetical protein